jgi:hypothetical protein
LEHLKKLAALLSDPRPTVRNAAQLALAQLDLPQLGKTPLPALVKETNGFDPLFAFATLSSLGQTSPEVKEAFRQWWREARILPTGFMEILEALAPEQKDELVRGTKRRSGGSPSEPSNPT